MKKEQKFIKDFEKKVEHTIRDYSLLRKEDKVLVACSGGKDSTTALYLLNKLGYKVEALFIDLHIGDWSKKNLANLKQFCEKERIKLHTVKIRDVLGAGMCFLRSKVPNLQACTVCGVIRRWVLNKTAKRLEADKLVTGHNLDDQAETILMNLLKNRIELNLGQQPKTGVVEEKGFVPRVKPLFFCLNEEVSKYSRLKGFLVLYEKCPCASGVFRWKIREEIKNLEKTSPGFKENSVKNFLRLIPLFKNSKNKKVEYCIKCGEPSRQKICNFCKIKERFK